MQSAFIRFIIPLLPAPLHPAVPSAPPLPPLSAPPSPQQQPDTAVVDMDVDDYPADSSTALSIGQQQDADAPSAASAPAERSSSAPQYDLRAFAARVKTRVARCMQAIGVTKKTYRQRGDFTEKRKVPQSRRLRLPPPPPQPQPTPGDGDDSDPEVIDLTGDSDGEGL